MDGMVTETNTCIVVCVLLAYHFSKLSTTTDWLLHLLSLMYKSLQVQVGVSVHMHIHK